MKRLVGPLALALFLVLAGPAGAQQSGFTVESVEVGDHPEVAITVTVETQLVAVPGFSLLENGQPRQLTVEAAAATDLTVVLAVDVSGSMRGAPLEAAKEAVNQFINRMPGGVQMSIVSIGSTPSLVAEFTEDKPTLLAAVETLSARGETALYDGVAAAATLLSAEGVEGRTIVLLSDGGDTVSGSSLTDAVEQLETLGAALYAVELQSPENDSEALQTLAAAAGGVVIQADDPAALETLFDDIASELLASYRLAFTSEAFDVASLDVRVLAGGAVVASANRVVDLPPAPTPVNPDPAPVVDPVVIPDPAPAPQPPPVVYTVELTWFDGDVARYLGAAAIFLAAATLFIIVSLRPRSRRKARGTSTLTSLPRSQTLAKKSALSAIAESATSLAEETLHRQDRLKTLNAALERGGIALRPGEFIILVASGALAAAAVGVVLLNPLFGVVFAGIFVMLVPAWVSSKSDKRRALFNDQLSDTLQLMATSMRAGYGLLQAIDAVAEEAPSPTAEEFQRIKIETHLGRDLDESLKAAADRVGSEDFRWVAEAIEIHRQIGGDLAEILDAVNETIRDRNRIRRRIKSLSAEGRISGVILSLIPVVLVFVILIINPDYIGELPTSGLGQALIAIGMVAWFIAVLWMRRIVRLQF